MTCNFTIERLAWSALRGFQRICIYGFQFISSELRWLNMDKTNRQSMQIQFDIEDWRKNVVQKIVRDRDKNMKNAHPDNSFERY